MVIFYTTMPDNETLNNRNVDLLNQDDKILMIVLLAPIFETLIFQFGIIEGLLILTKKIKLSNHYLLIILISSIAFSLSHFGSIFTIIHSFFSGLVLSTLYIYARVKELKPFFSTFLVHSLFNLTLFFLNEY